MEVLGTKPLLWPNIIRLHFAAPNHICWKGLRYLRGLKKTLWNGYPERSYIKCFCDKGMLSAATNNSIIIVVCSEQTPIIQIWSLAPFSKPKLYNYNALLLSGDPIIFKWQGPALRIPILWPFLGHFQPFIFISWLFRCHI